jgi:ABC-type sugar transport system ATPase subunit
MSGSTPPQSRADTPTNGQSPLLLEAGGIFKWFGHVCALRDVNLAIREGEVVGLVGDNGAGKSTLVKILAGVHQPTTGDLFVRGQRVSFSSPLDARKLGIETVYQDLALIERFDVAENFFLGREITLPGPLRTLRFMRRRAMGVAAGDALERLHVKIPGGRGLTVSRMSGGQRQAIALARGAFWSKNLLILDEPTAALGVAESREVLNLIERMTERGLAMIVVTHNLEHLWTIATRIVVLRRGTKVADVSKAETSSHDVVSYITGVKTEQLAIE